MDVAEPDAARSRWRRYAAVGGEYLRQGSRHCAGSGARVDFPAADGCRGAPVVSGRGCAWRGRERRCVRDPGVAGADRDRTAMNPERRLDYQASIDRPRLALPDGKRVAVFIVVNVENWDV